MATKIRVVFQLIGIGVCALVLCFTVPNATASVSFPTTAAMDKIYPVVEVEPGDTISSLAQQYGLSWQGVYCTNEKEIGSDPNFIHVGEHLKMEVMACPQYSGYGNTATTITTAEYNTTGTPQSIAWSLLANFGGDRQVQYDCLNNIIMGESSWNITAENPSGAYGIPQALPGYKMGPGWETSAYVQLYWMIKEYIPSTYGTPCDAWAFHEANGYY